MKIIPFVQLDSAVEKEGVVQSNFTNLKEGIKSSLESNALILATGYDHSNKHPLLSNLSPYLISTPTGNYDVKRNYCLATCPEFIPHIFLQGLCEKTHGISDTLLSILSIRASEILQELLVTIVSDKNQEARLLTSNF